MGLRTAIRMVVLNSADSQQFEFRYKLLAAFTTIICTINTKVAKP